MGGIMQHQTRIRSRIRSLVLGLTILVAHTGAEAALVTINFKAVNTFVDSEYAGYFGTTATGSITWDTSISDTNVETPGSTYFTGSYNGAVTHFSFTSTNADTGLVFNAAGVPVGPSNLVSFISVQDETVSPLRDRFIAKDALTTNVTALPDAWLELDILWTAGAGLFISDALPLSAAEFANPNTAFWRKLDIDFPSTGVGVSTWDITEITAGVNPVPLPAAVWLFGPGFLGLLGLAKRKAA
jgi:hypothetical protein